MPARVDTVPRSDTNAESKIGGSAAISLQTMGGASKGATEDTVWEQKGHKAHRRSYDMQVDDLILLSMALHKYIPQICR